MVSLILLAALALGQSPRALDVEFDAAQEAFVDRCQQSPNPFQAQIDQLDSDRYAERAKAGAKLAAIAATDPSTARWIMRARAAERRAEVRYWLNRTLRTACRCDRCEGAGHCAKYDPLSVNPALYQAEPCRRCGRCEWQHGGQWIAEGIYGNLPCPECSGTGTHWRHWSVD